MIVQERQRNSQSLTGRLMDWVTPCWSRSLKVSPKQGSGFREKGKQLGSRLLSSPRRYLPNQWSVSRSDPPVLMLFCFIFYPLYSSPSTQNDEQCLLDTYWNSIWDSWPATKTPSQPLQVAKVSQKTICSAGGWGGYYTSTVYVLVRREPEEFAFTRRKYKTLRSIRIDKQIQIINTLIKCLWGYLLGTIYLRVWMTLVS